MIIVLPREHFLLARFGHPLPVVLHAEKDMIAVAPADDEDAPATLHTLKTMLNRILDQRLENEFWHIASHDAAVHIQRHLQTPLEAPLLDFQIGAQEG